jgi:hypothetical protein
MQRIKEKAQVDDIVNNFPDLSGLNNSIVVPLTTTIS